MSFLEVKDVQDLQVGSFVKLEGSWFSHPFPTNMFLIKSAEDLATIQGLSHVTILSDPDRSHFADSDDDRTNGEELLEPAEESVEAETLETSSMEDHGNLQEDESLISVATLSEIVGRREDYHEFYDHLQKVEGTYKKTLSQGQELFQQLSGRRPAGLKTGDAMITDMMQSLNNPKTAMSLIDLVGSNGVTWGLSEHAMNVCTLSLLIGRQFSLEDDVLLELGRGALFHDVGYRALPMNVKFQARGMKVEANPELRVLHPELGSKLMASFLNAGPLLIEIIAHHHERLDGSGFPKGLRKEHLSLLTRIVMVADHYDELCNARNPETSLNPHAALSRLYRHVVMKGEDSKFCERVVQALVQAIGVYPPGSLVELTDGFTGIVSSINVHHPTKPTVLLYAPWLCRNDGLLVNLAKEHTLHIKQALHPKDVPEQVLAYLSPRRMSMFIHAEPISMGFNSRPSRRKKKAGKF